LHRTRQQEDASQLVLAWFCQSRSNGFGGCEDIHAGELEECQARLAVCAAGSGVAKGPPGQAQFAEDEMDHAQFVVGDPSVQ
jgi:hypothetical protein